jgi:hypothetical protein
MGSARNANRKAVLSGIVDGMGKSEATYPFEQILTITIRQELSYTMAKMVRTNLGDFIIIEDGKVDDEYLNVYS